MTKPYYLKIGVVPPGKEDFGEYMNIINELNTVESWSKKYGSINEIKSNQTEPYDTSLVRYFKFTPKGTEENTKKFRATIIKKGLRFHKIKGDELQNFNLEQIVANK